jgi:DNA-binding transcriptional LysR family regulator
MTARTQYDLTAADLNVVLALVRAGTLAAAGERLGVDASTVFRTLQKVERGLGRTLFERSRSGYAATDLARTLAEQAEQMETALEVARSAVQAVPAQVSGTVRITTTDTILHGLVAPALKDLVAEHPLLNLELHTANEVVSLTRREADIAVRATMRPPQHLVGRRLGPIRLGLYAAKKAPLRRAAARDPASVPWIATDDMLPDHPSVLWRRKHFPKVVPGLRVNSVLAVMELIALGLGIGVLPVFLAAGRPDLVALEAPEDDHPNDLWLLTHRESRHLRRVSAVYGHLAEWLVLK